MSIHERTVAEINAVLDELAERGEVWSASWVLNKVLSQHSHEIGGDFAHYHVAHHVRQLVGRAISKRAGDPTGTADDAQFKMILDGYTRVQRYYMVNREGSDIGVPVWTMTDEEIDAKCDLYESNADALNDHAGELRRYKTERRVAKTA